jgi:hypothetical protein
MRRGRKTDPSLVELVRQLARILDRKGILSARGNRWTQSRVLNFRQQHRIRASKNSDSAGNTFFAAQQAIEVLLKENDTSRDGGQRCRERSSPGVDHRSLIQVTMSQSHCRSGHLPKEVEIMPHRNPCRPSHHGRVLVPSSCSLAC